MNTRSRFVIFAVTVTGIALGAGRASAGSIPFDAAGPGGGAVAAPNVLVAPPFLLGEIDLSLLGVPESELASIGPAGATADPPADGPNTLIVDDDRADCPDAAFTSIQAAVDAAGPGDKIKVCPGTYQEQVRIGLGKNGLLLFSQIPLQAIIKAPLLMTQPNSIVLVDGADDVTIRQFTISGPYTFGIPGTCAEAGDRHTGVRIFNGSATLYGNHITQIRDVNPALFGCQDGIGVLVGRQFEVQVGTATIRNNLIDLYQKGGIVVDNAGSYALVTENDISGEGLSNIIAQNGVQIGRGASADAAFAGSQQNQIAYNKAFDNTPVDCYDETAGGGTAETANFWVHDMGGTENRSGLCKSKP